jgi:hypothetical protein
VSDPAVEMAGLRKSYGPHEAVKVLAVLVAWGIGG